MIEQVNLPICCYPVHELWTGGASLCCFQFKGRGISEFCWGTSNGVFNNDCTANVNFVLTSTVGREPVCIQNRVIWFPQNKHFPLVLHYTVEPAIELQETHPRCLLEPSVFVQKLVFWVTERGYSGLLHHWAVMNENRWFVTKWLMAEV
jgi:hypothetical protein